MKEQVRINGDMITWAIDRAGFELNEFADIYPKVELWLSGEKKPTIKQLEDFSRKVYLPFGYLFLDKPPHEKLPIPFFRSNGKQKDRIHINVIDTITSLQQRQNWLRNYLKENEFDRLPFVGKFINQKNVRTIVDDIRHVLGLEENWASRFKTWQEAQNHLILHIEDIGIITIFNGIVENNTHRPIPVEDCRGFVLVDEYAPFMFINNADFKSAQMFTMIHELAHIWTGVSAGFDFRNMLPANDPIEILCDKIAAEFLVPENEFSRTWNINKDIKHLSRYFKVSSLVIARRAFDTGKWNRKEFFTFYNEYIKGEFLKKENQSSGGDFYATTKKRISITYASHIKQAVLSGDLLYRDAYHLTGLKGNTFENFMTKHM